jgi:hypothetical protein
MRARSLIDGALYGPDALKAMGLAFDAAWAHIAGNFGSDPSAARLTLADALLSVADEKTLRQISTAAMQRMALDYRSLRGTGR